MTMIDKAEAHDDDLIRRGDALRVADEVFDKCQNVHGDDRGAFAAAEVGARIAALPALAPTATFRDGWAFAYRQWQATGSVPDPDYKSATTEEGHE